MSKYQPHPGIAAVLTQDQRELLATVANSEGTTGGPWLDSDNVLFLTRHGVHSVSYTHLTLPTTPYV